MNFHRGYMDAYKILGVSYEATLDECKKAYRRLCMVHHPDNGGDTNTFAEINKAWSLIQSGRATKPRPESKHLIFESLFRYTLA